MAGAIKKYPIDQNRLAYGLREGFDLPGGGVLRTAGAAPRRTLILAPLDSGREGCEWGRLSYRAAMPAETALIVRAFASDEQVFLAEGEEMPVGRFLLDPARPLRQKWQLFEAAGALKDTGHRDMLLYGQRGRWLYLAFELLGEGDAAFSDIFVTVPGDNFYDTFPEVWHTDDDFFRRYLSVFSTLYNDFEEKIDALPAVVDIEAASMPLLETFARWMGIAPKADLLGEEELRALLRMAWPLIREKGTRRTLEKLVAMLLGGAEDVILIENAYENSPAGGEALLYGGNPYGFTILLNRTADEALNARLRLLVDQFRPLRSQVNIVFAAGQRACDSYCCLDLNAALVSPGPGALDRHAGLNGTVVLE